MNEQDIVRTVLPCPSCGRDVPWTGTRVLAGESTSWVIDCEHCGPYQHTKEAA